VPASRMLRMLEISPVVHHWIPAPLSCLGPSTGLFQANNSGYIRCCGLSYDVNEQELCISWNRKNAFRYKCPLSGSHKNIELASNKRACVQS